MAFNDPRAPHPITLGVIVPLANKAQFRQDLRDAADVDPNISFQEIRRILAGDDALIGEATTTPGGSIVEANALNVHLTEQEWDFLKAAKQLLDPSFRSLVEFSRLRSLSRPDLDDFWTWAATVGWHPVESGAP